MLTVSEEWLRVDTGPVLGLLLLDREVSFDVDLGSVRQGNRHDQSRIEGFVGIGGSPFRQRCKTGDRGLSERPDRVKVGRVLVSF
jgi:hypothetical protein